ncbi:MAG: sensor histidine kinase [Candidatus Kapaibacterium sp.]|nr:MAG: sensor histidine kinase [Candidatus Kapabacteria bacterium]
MPETELSSVFREEETLARFAKTIAEQPLDVLEAKDLHQEYGRLSASYNHLLRQMMAMTRISDVSQTKLFRLQTELKAALSESKGANTRKTELLSVVAHDLKSPIATILAIVKLMELGDITPNEFPEAAGSIRETAERMIHLIDSLLASSALEMGKMNTDKKKQLFMPVLERVVKENRVRAAEKGQKIHLIVPEVSDGSFAPQLFFDANLLHQVLENLASNAVKYSPPGTEITVRVEETPDKMLRVSMQDQGQGLTDEDKSKLFGYFQRLSATPTGGESSHGVGLAITKRIIDLHEGTIWVESEYGNGATFIVELPLQHVV